MDDIQATVESRGNLLEECLRDTRPLNTPRRISDGIVKYYGGKDQARVIPRGEDHD